MNVRVFLVLLSFGLVLARPGGYKNLGGVYTPVKELDYMDAAKSAGKFAWSKKFEEELSPADVNRGERRAEYVPTFFTSKDNHAALTNSRPAEESLRLQHETPEDQQFNAPLYYQQY